MKILAFGEILWDIFGGEQKLGGAPLNFITHCTRLGAQTQIISAVGKDTLGKQALDMVKMSGVGTDYIETLKKIPTGYCEVTLDENGTPSYYLASGVAYDNIPCPKRIDKDYDALYFGSLALREEKSMESFLKLVSKGVAKEVFCDINVRQDFCTGEILETCLKNATILKFSREEMEIFGKVSLIATAEYILSVYTNIHTVVITMDADGACCFTRKGRWFAKSPESEVVSTVGAGDSFSAAFLVNYLAGEKVSVCLNRACTLGSYVVTQLGAIPEYPEQLLAQIKPQ